MNVGADASMGSPPSPPLSDERVRDRIRRDLGTTLIIEAAAGTGKTTALVNRIIAVIASRRAAIDHIVALTFTEKAAGELKLRLRAEIERARHADSEFDLDSRRYLTEALEKLEEARIGTIHSFCADLLRERPVEAHVDPMFEVAAGEASGALFAAAFDGWFQDTLAAPGEGVRRILRRRELADREGPRPLLTRAAWDLLEWRDFDASWAYEQFERDRAIDTLVGEILALDELARQADPEDWLRRSFEEIARAVKEAIRLEGVRDRDYDALEDTLLRLLRGQQRHWGWKGRGDRFGPVTRAEAFARRDALLANLKQFRERSGANLAPMLRDEMWPVVARYAEAKRRAGRLDFLDLLLIARDLVRDNPLVRAELQTRYTHIFVDEFQDTDPLQAEILLLLAADDSDETDWLNVTPVHGKLFIVGDPKQSIYRFRRADVTLYQSIKRRLVARGAALEYLTVSFRATPELQRMVNGAFAPLMATESETQPAYAALEPFRPSHGAQPGIVALPVPEPYGDYGRIIKWRLDQSLPDVISAFVEWLISQSGWTVTERDAPQRSVAIRPRHICILFRRLNAYGRDVTRPYVRALEGRHLPHILVRGGSFNEREEVGALRNALAAIERPDDELSTFATLRGPLFSLSDGALLQFRETYHSFHPFRAVDCEPSGALQEVAAALKVLRDLHRGRNRRPIADTIARLLAATRAHAAIAIWPTGEQALANVMRVMDMARRYEATSGATSMRGFVDYLEARATSDEMGEAPVVEEGTEGVRLMTVHSAKGLEFPVVVMADITCNETAREPRRFVDPTHRRCVQMLAGCSPRELLDHCADEQRRDEEEAVRVLYVAATRARDLIVVPAVGDERHDGWLKKLTPAIYPTSAAGRTPLNRAPAGCPEFTAPFVGKRPPNAQGNPQGVAPGLHQPENGEHRVVWWDPLMLKLDVQETMGLRQHKLLQADENNARSERGKREYSMWKESRDALIAEGATPSMRVATATELSALGATPKFPEMAQIEIEEVARVVGRPRGPHFGSLVHAILSRVSLQAEKPEVEAAADFFGRTLGASEDEITAATEAIMRGLASATIRRAAAAREIRRETPLAVTLEDGTVIEGIADLAFRDEANGAGWVVADFKTDFDLVARLDEYRVQLGFYIRAIQAATALPASGVILWI